MKIQLILHFDFKNPYLDSLKGMSLNQNFNLNFLINFLNKREITVFKACKHKP